MLCETEGLSVSNKKIDKNSVPINEPLGYSNRIHHPPHPQHTCVHVQPASYYRRWTLPSSSSSSSSLANGETSGGHT